MHVHIYKHIYRKTCGQQTIAVFAKAGTTTAPANDLPQTFALSVAKLKHLAPCVNCLQPSMYSNNFTLSSDGLLAMAENISWTSATMSVTDAVVSFMLLNTAKSRSLATWYKS